MSVIEMLRQLTGTPGILTTLYPKRMPRRFLRFGLNVYWGPCLVHGSAIHGVSRGDR